MGIIERLFKKTKETDKKLKLSLEYEEKYRNSMCAWKK